MHLAENGFTAHGNRALAFVTEMETENGDLVDREYYCSYHAPVLMLGQYYSWPAYDWPEYSIYCKRCSALLNKAHASE